MEFTELEQLKMQSVYKDAALISCEVEIHRLRSTVAELNLKYKNAELGLLVSAILKEKGIDADECIISRDEKTNVFSIVPNPGTK